MDFNSIAAPLGAILAVLAAALTWKLTEAKRERDAQAAQKMPSVVQASIIAQAHGPNLIADAITDSVKCICEVMKEHIDCQREYERARRNNDADIKEALVEMNRSLTIIARRLGERHPHHE